MKAYRSIIFFFCLVALVLANDCFVGEYKNSKGECEQCHISCATCSSSEGCSTCYDQMFLNAVGNQIHCQLCFKVNTNCQICTSAQKCKLCTNGYYLNENSTCSACSEHTPHCLFCQQKEKYVKCITCQFPRRIINGQCLFGNETDNTEPVAATSSETPAETAAVQPAEGGAANGNEAGGQVSLCSLNQIEINGVCVLAIPFCLNYNTVSLLCRECGSDTVLSDQGYCVPAFIIGNQNHNGQGQGSVETTTGNQGTNRSQQKVANETAEDCVENQYFWYGRCVTIGTECLNRTENNKCEGCIRGFELRNGYCMQLPPEEENAGEQIPPEDGGQGLLQNGVAVGAPSCNFPCLTCSSQSADECLTCVQGYTTVDAFPGVCFSLN